MGLETVAIARGADKGPLAQQLGVHHYIDSTAEDPAEAQQRLGGADVILATVTAADAMSATFGGLRPRRPVGRGLFGRVGRRLALRGGGSGACSSGEFDGRRA
jgi:hypothetical protein